MAVIASLLSGILGILSASLALAGGGTWGQFWLVYALTSLATFLVLMLLGQNQSRLPAHAIEQEIAEELALVSPQGKDHVLAARRPLR